MIHVAIAAPLGLDSVFFSYLLRLAHESGLEVLDGPMVDAASDKEDGEWVDSASSDSIHRLVIGYRYPPSYWQQLMDKSSTVVVLSDFDGIVRQVSEIISSGSGHEDIHEETGVPEALQRIIHGVDYYVQLIERVLALSGNKQMLAVPVVGLKTSLSESLSRIETFYKLQGLPVVCGIASAFANEALPVMNRLTRVDLIHKSLIAHELLMSAQTQSKVAAIRDLVAGAGGA